MFEFFFTLKKRIGLGGAIMLFGLLRAVPMLLMVAGFPLLAVRGEWLDAVMCIVLGFVTLTVGALAEARVKEKAEAETKADNDGNDNTPKPNPPVAETVAAPIPVPAAETTEQKPVPEKCLTRDCRKPRTSKDGGFHWWCFDCWGKRDGEFTAKGILPQCFTEGCTEMVSKIYHPWCWDCWQYKEERGNDPIRTESGHRVRSEPEKRIADFLFRNDIRFAYEKELPNSGTPPLLYDFFLPPKGERGGVFIEFFGWLNHDKPKVRNEYLERTKRKRQYYARNKFDCIELLPEHSDNLEKHLADELRKRDYQI